MFRFLTEPFQNHPILDPFTRKLKNALKNALSIVENAVVKDMESSLSRIPPTLFNNADVYSLIQNSVRKLQSISSDIEKQQDKSGLLTVTRDLLASEEDIVSTVLNFAIAVQLSELLLNRRFPILLENKNFNQLVVAARNSMLIVNDVRNEVERDLRVNVKNL